MTYTILELHKCILSNSFGLKKNFAATTNDGLLGFGTNLTFIDFV